MSSTVPPAASYDVPIDFSELELELEASTSSEEIKPQSEPSLKNISITKSEQTEPAAQPTVSLKQEILKTAEPIPPEPSHAEPPREELSKPAVSQTKLPDAEHPKTTIPPAVVRNVPSSPASSAILPPASPIPVSPVVSILQQIPQFTIVVPQKARPMWELSRQQFVISEKLGSGALGDTYLAVVNNRQVVLKKILPQPTEAVFIREFVQEIDCLRYCDSFLSHHSLQTA